MKKIFLVISFLFILIFSTSLFHSNVYSDSLEDQLNQINKQMSELQQALDASRKASAPLESQLKNLKVQLDGISQRVNFIEADIANKRKIINDGYKDLAVQKDLFNRAVRNYYIKSYYSSPFLVFISANDASNVTQILAYQKKSADQDKAIITNLAIKITDLEQKELILKDEEQRLAQVKTKLDSEKAEVEKVVTGAKAYQSSLSSQIAQLSAQQQQLIAQKLGSLNIPRSAGTGAPACIDDRNIDPGFSPRFALFTYGVPNRTGLNQYGANGRAKAGQNIEQILNAYYANFELKKDYDTGININVDGYGTYNIEDYVKRIYEMPGDWEIEALKAQAVAARSYALSYTNNGSGSICTTQSCQVFKPDPKGGRWEEAVNATRGWVMVQGGGPIKTWYSSTHGGYVLSTSELSGWQSTSWTKHATDTTSGSAGSFSDLNSTAYDRESPWFYCDWGARASYNKTAWLKPSEIADIINTILLARADSSAKDHLYQPDKSHPYGGEVWDQERVKSELRGKNITPYNSISDISIGVDFGSGKTTSVNISGDGGSESFNGSEFKDWFNLRAPSNIQIVGPLYNVEKR